VLPVLIKFNHRSWRNIYCTHKGYDDLAIRIRLEFITRVARSSQVQVVVNLAINGENNLPVVAKKRLRAGI
jgi:hypothetical protein